MTVRRGMAPVRSNVKTIFAAVLFSLVAWLAFTLPDHPDALGVASFLRLPLEWPLMALAVLVTRGWLKRLVIFLCGFLVFLVLLLKLADIGVESAFQRPFNPYLDVKMLRDGWNLISGTIGTPSAIFLLVTGFALLIAIVMLFLKALAWMSQAKLNLRRLLIGGFGAVLALGGLAMASGLRGVELDSPAYLSQRLNLIIHSVADMRVFEQELDAGIGPKGGADLFGAVRGKDVVVVFVESYGRSAVEDPRYADTMRPRLRAIDDEIGAAGLSAVSGWITSPTVGGISWLAHGTLLSGLWVDSQARYDRLMISAQPSLNRLFTEAGWRSVAVMPAITMAWPEADYFGYDQILSASGLQYRGKPFNWVTMPDQYTLSAFDRLALKPAHAAGHKVMAEIALISSHAPWTPVPKRVGWQSVGDGTVFNEQASAGDPPSVVWADPERVRRQYIETIDYSMATLGEFVARQGRDTIYVILGDHQPASIITGPDASRAVPVHIVSADPALLQRFVARGFTKGMTPGATTREWPMNALRGLLIDIFSAKP